MCVCRCFVGCRLVANLGFCAQDADDNPYHRLFLEGHDHAVRALAARGRTLVSGSYDCTIRVWDLVTGACRWVLVGHTQKGMYSFTYIPAGSLNSLFYLVYSVVLDPPRHQACSGSMDGTVRIWDLKTGRCAHTLTGHTSLVGLLGLSPRTLVSAAADSTLRVWDPETGALLHTLAAHTGAITCFQHDEFKVLSGSDGTLKMWNLRDGSVQRDLLTGITGVWQVVFEGRWCVAASNQTRGGTVQTVLDVWDFAEAGEDWVGEPPGGVYDESESEGSDDEEEEDGRYRYTRGPRSMDIDMVVEEDDAQEQADVDAMDQDLLVPPSEDGSGSERGNNRESADIIEVDEPPFDPVSDDGEAEGVRASRWAPLPPMPRAGSSRHQAQSAGGTSSGAITRSRRTPASTAPPLSPSQPEASTSTSTSTAVGKSAGWRRSATAEEPPPRPRALRRGSR